MGKSDMGKKERNKSRNDDDSDKRDTQKAKVGTVYLYPPPNTQIKPTLHPSSEKAFLFHLLCTGEASIVVGTQFSSPNVRWMLCHISMKAPRITHTAVLPYKREKKNSIGNRIENKAYIRVCIALYCT